MFLSEISCLVLRRITGDIPEYSHQSLGWLVGGEISKDSLTNVSNITMTTDNTVEKQLQKFWEIEEYKQKSNWSQQDDLCETHFLSNHKR
jgi:hypothetical protein